MKVKDYEVISVSVDGYITLVMPMEEQRKYGKSENATEEEKLKNFVPFVDVASTEAKKGM